MLNRTLANLSSQKLVLLRELSITSPNNHQQQNQNPRPINPKPKNPELERILAKIDQLPIKMNSKLLNASTLHRIGQSPLVFVAELVQNLHDYGIRDKYLTHALQVYDDWSLLTRPRLAEICELFRSLSMKAEIYLPIVAQNSQILNETQITLANRLKDLRFFFTNRHLDRILPRSPHLLTNNFDLFRYKFMYVFVLMGIGQLEMSSTRLFDYELEFIRQRHLFLERALFYSKPNKKGETKVDNPKLAFIVDSTLKDYLRLCTRDILGEEEYATFGEYLREEKFDNELLGGRIDKVLKNQIIEDIQMEKKREND